MAKPSLLDNIYEMLKIDKNNVLELCLKTPEHCKNAMKLAQIPKRVRRIKPRNILVAGMGGSAIGGEILREWLIDRISIPIEVCKDYILPAYVNEDTLVFAVSYSGETEETLTAFIEAMKRKSMVVSITSGGRLQKFSEKLGVPFVRVPEGLAPRIAFPYLFFPMIQLLKQFDIISGYEEEIEEAIQVLENIRDENAPAVPLKENFAKKLAWELKDSVPIVYGFRQYCPVARRLKSQFNENSKIPSFFDVFPELNHNEIMGWEARGEFTKIFLVILIRDENEPPEIRHKIELTKELALQKAKKVLEIHAKGEGKLARMLSVLYLGDLTSVYLAILHGVDPLPVETISKLKKQMEKKLNVAKGLEAEVEKLLRKNQTSVLFFRRQKRKTAL